jgi:hypothetical protein
LHLLLLYVVQLLLLLQLLPEDARRWLRLLGFYAAGLSADEPLSDVNAMQLSHFVVLHLLYAAIGLNVALTRQPLYKHLRMISEDRPGVKSVEAAPVLQGLQEPLLQSYVEGEVALQVGTPGERHSGSGTIDGVYVPSGRISSTAVPEDEEAYVQLRATGTSSMGDDEGPGRNWSPSPGLAGTSPTWRPPSLLRWSSIRDWEPLQRFVADGGFEGDPGASVLQFGTPLSGERGMEGGNAGAGGNSSYNDGGPGAGAAGMTWPAWSQLRLLLHVLLPLLLHGAEVVLGSLAAVPAMGAIAMAGFAMVQVRGEGALDFPRAHVVVGPLVGGLLGWWATPKSQIRKI